MRPETSLNSTPYARRCGSCRGPSAAQADCSPPRRPVAPLPWQADAEQDVLAPDRAGKSGLAATP